MRKDPTEFRERFLRWKEGDQVYEAGLPKYGDGLTPYRKRPLDKNMVVNFLYGVENPFMKNVNTDLGVAKVFDDGSAPTIGPGVANTSNAPKEWFNGKWHSKESIDDYAYQHFSHDDDVIRNAYDTRFGTKDYPHPSDTLSIWPRLYMAQNRYQLGNLGGTSKRRDAILDAVSTGDTQNIINTISEYGKEGDKDRMRRVMESYQPIYPKSAFDLIKMKFPILHK